MTSGWGVPGGGGGAGVGGVGGVAGGGASPGLPRGVAAAASAVSIASMHQQKKRGIKSSLGRFFSKKDKAGMPVSRTRIYIVIFNVSIFKIFFLLHKITQTCNCSH